MTELSKIMIKKLEAAGVDPDLYKFLGDIALTEFYREWVQEQRKLIILEGSELGKRSF